MLEIITLILLLILGSTSTCATRCPFQYLYEFGDGFGDIGNSIQIFPEGPFLPAARLPYGTTFPNTPTGRWCDGRIEADFAADALGLPNIRPYLSSDSNSSSDGVVFSVAGSPALDRQFFRERGITIPSYATSLASQLTWFRTYLTSLSLNTTESANRVANSVILLVNPQAHDIAYALLQGKSIHEVITYVPSIVQVQIDATRTLIKMGARRIIISGKGALGCYPYILTALPNTNPLAYDSLGCLKSVNALVVSVNISLQLAIIKLKMEFPNVTILYVDDYLFTTTIITQMIASDGGKIGLRACCGTGGKYNYDSARFCGSPGVPVCANPNQYIFWDGMHFTQEVYRRIVNILAVPALVALKCTIS